MVSIYGGTEGHNSDGEAFVILVNVENSMKLSYVIEGLYGSQFNSLCLDLRSKSLEGLGAFVNLVNVEKLVNSGPVIEGIYGSQINSLRPDFGSKTLVGLGFEEHPNFFNYVIVSNSDPSEPILNSKFRYESILDNAVS